MARLLAVTGRGVTAVHRGKNLLVTGEVARLLDPTCRAKITRIHAADLAGADCSIIWPPRDHPASMTCVSSSASNGKNCGSAGAGADRKR